MGAKKLKLNVDDLTKTYVNEDGSKTKAIHDVWVKVFEKEFVAIVGPSGCGKSTLLRSVAGLVEPTVGKVELNGEKVTQPRREIGLVFQHPASFPWLTVLENVEFGLKLRKTYGKDSRERARHFIDLVGLSGFENSYVETLSGGMKQRVAIATVLANKPELLLMDEPFSALDAQTRALMQELVLSVWQETKNTVLFVTHDIEEAIFLADRVYIMSARPGEIKDVIKINLPRPRRPAMKLSEDFLKIKKHISYIIRGEAIKAAHVQVKNLRPNAIRIGTHTWPGNMPFYLANEVGLFEKNGLEIEMTNLEKEENRVEAIEKGRVDLINLTADGAVLAEARGLDLRIFLCLSKSTGGDAILAMEGISKVEDLKGKKIAVEEGWVSHFFLLYVLNKYGIKSSEVEMVDMKGSDIGAALIAHEVEAAVLWEPWLTQAQNLSGAKVLVSSKQVPVIVDVLATTEKYARENPDILKRVSQTWFDALKFLEKKPERSRTLMAIPLGVSTMELQGQLKNLELLDHSKNVFLLGGRGKKAKLTPLLGKISDIWIKEKFIEKKVDEKDLIDGRFV